ncbi:uncharacterized protein EV154DRAFT_591451 [Mucor mucedo]|uniref:uncharacterized protein n=1 Tax=Mucor mucedo TaxID=29922 RepID=UPI00221FA430|nr:uncharacterized protein EV154DRAFT_591451 [Mucor mucedo]KAI7889798.1 hypothetical protein EV154DRAFT_591451 [Mucor mucedo]
MHLLEWNNKYSGPLNPFSLARTHYLRAENLNFSVTSEQVSRTGCLNVNFTRSALGFCIGSGKSGQQWTRKHEVGIAELGTVELGKPKSATESNILFDKLRLVFGTKFHLNGVYLSQDVFSFDYPRTRAQIQDKGIQKIIHAFSIVDDLFVDIKEFHKDYSQDNSSKMDCLLKGTKKSHCDVEDWISEVVSDENVGHDH